MRFSTHFVPLAGMFGLLIVACGNVADAATPKADYRFNNTFASSIGTAPDLTPIAQSSTTGTFATETVDGMPNTPVFQFSGNRGLIADTNGVVPNNSYSVVFYARLNIAEPAGTPPVNPIVKILDFKNRTSDSGQYVVGGQPTFYDGLLPVVPGAGLFVNNVYAQFVLTRDASNVVNAYLNGAPLYTFNDTTGLATLDQNLLTLFADDPNSSGVPTGLQIETADGAIARLRLYDGPLTPQEVAGLDTIPEPATTAFFSLTLLASTLRSRRRPTRRRAG